MLNTEIHCKLLNENISDTVCFEICLAVEGMIKMTSVPEVTQRREEAQKICFACENYKE